LIVDGTRELMSDAMAAAREARPSLTDESGETTVTEDVKPLPKKQSVLAYPASSAADELALHMLGQLLEKTPVAMEVLSSHTLISELITATQERGCPIVCIADLPPSPPSKTRYLIKKLRSALPDVRIVVGRWAPTPLADEDARPLMEAGATHVASTMIETANQLRQLAELSPQTQPDAETTKPTLVA
jgi:hypothetical protein